MVKLISELVIPVFFWIFSCKKTCNLWQNIKEGASIFARVCKIPFDRYYRFLISSAQVIKKSLEQRMDDAEKELFPS